MNNLQFGSQQGNHHSANACNRKAFVNNEGRRRNAPVIVKYFASLSQYRKAEREAGERTNVISKLILIAECQFPLANVNSVLDVSINV